MVDREEREEWWIEREREEWWIGREKDGGMMTSLKLSSLHCASNWTPCLYY